MVRKLLIVVPVILALTVISLFMPARHVTIEGIGTLSFETAVTLSVGQQEAYASPDTETLRPEGVGNSTNLSQYPAIAVDAVSTNSGNTSPITVSHTTGSGTNRLMLVGIYGDYETLDVSSVKYNNVDLELVGTYNRFAVHIWIYKLVAPPTGTYDLVVTFDPDPAWGGVVGVMTFTGVDQTTPLGTFVCDQSSSTTASVDVSSASGELVFDTVGARAALTVGEGQTERWNLAPDVDNIGAGSTEPGATTVTMSWTLAESKGWCIGAVPIKPAYTNWECVDEVTHDDNDTYVHADGVVLRDTYAMEDHSAGSGTINKVTTYFWCAREGFTYCGFNPVMRTHDTDYLENAQSVSASEPTYEEHTQEYINNPDTGSTWTWAEVDAMEVGVENYHHDTWGTGNLRVTQVYAVVDYTPPPAWLNCWAKRVKITIDHNDFVEDATHFPVLIHLSTSSGREPDDVSFVFDELDAGGGQGSYPNRKKIAVTKDNGTTPLFVEIEEWDDGATGNEKAWLWVSKSDWTISSTVDTDIYLYYDNSQLDNTDWVGDSGSRTEVWDGDFKGVWHLSETSSEIEFVNETHNYGASSSTTIAAAAANHTAGNLLVVIVGDYGAANVSSIADTAGNTYTYVIRKHVSGVGTSEIWYAKNISGNASNVVTATFESSTDYREISVLQYSGADTSDPYDVSNTGSGSGTSQTTAASTTTYADEVIVAGYCESDTGTFTAGTNFTLRYDGEYLGTEDRIVSSTGSYGSAITYTGADYAAVHATFKAASTPDPIKDSTSNVNHGTDENSPTLGATGKIDNAVSFDGGNDRRINCGTDGSLDISSGTLEAWIYPEGWGPGGWGTIMDRGGSVNYWGYQFAVTDENSELMIYGDGSYVGSGSGTISLDSWQHVVVVLTGSVAKFYVNGDAKATPDWALAAKGAATFYIAWCAEPAGEEFDGIIDEVRVSNTTRTAPWISATYESGRDDLLDFGTEETLAVDITNLPTSKDFGVVGASSTPNTGNAYFTITNSSTVTIDINIKCNGWTPTIGPGTWVYGPPVGADKGFLKASSANGGTGGSQGAGLYDIEILNGTDSLLCDDVAVGTNPTWELQLNAPSSFTHGDEQQTTVTLTATCAP